ncbi:CinA family protein [Occultella glacieicola]|uniref:CinA family protein n=1 Tax=Occultella glacieicola TaxID=2518684 RepID=A0ABY2E3F2_9MICO|nr:CinA family protein [Occultella glacieicola]TDE90766.1 CinA family protein [Occultella glacieicola]
MPADRTAAILARLIDAGRTLAVAESLTGGALAAELVSVPGVSAVLRGGVVAYATDLKTSVLGVDEDLLAAHGPVHPQVALEMADGVRARLGADIGLGTTGVAGPGPADGRPAGTVFVACTTPTWRTVRGYHLAGTRPAVRSATVALALALLRQAGEQVGDRSRWDE